MDRLTKYSKETSHENGICCTHFFGPECLGVGGNCAMNCKWEEAVWSRLAAYEDTGLTPEEVRSMHGEWSAMMSALNSIGGGYARLRELAESDKDSNTLTAYYKVQSRRAGQGYICSQYSKRHHDGSDSPECGCCKKAIEELEGGADE